MTASLRIPHAITPKGLNGFLRMLDSIGECMSPEAATRAEDQLNAQFPHDGDNGLDFRSALRELTEDTSPFKRAGDSEYLEIWTPKSEGSHGYFCTVVLLKGEVGFDHVHNSTEFNFVLPYDEEIDTDADFNGVGSGWHVMPRGSQHGVSGRALIVYWSKTRIVRV